MNSKTENSENSAAKAAKILRILFTNANGDSAKAIKKYQGNELPSFGIMYPQLKDLAKKHPQDNAVAELLLDKNTREAKIMAILLCNPLNISENFRQNLTIGATTDELKNIVARHLAAPIIKSEGTENLSKWLPKSILIKGVIQNYRLYQSKPDFNESINLIMQAASGNDKVLNQDKKNLAGILYREYPNIRKTLMDNLRKLQMQNNNLKNEIEEWVKDFKYIVQ